MKSSKLTRVLLGKQYIGIEHFSFKNEDQIAVLLIESANDGLSIIKKDKVPKVNLLDEKWNKNLPFFLTLNTNQIIQKEVQGTEANDEKLLHKAFPNISGEDFYYEIFRMKSKSIIAISRKSHIDEVLATYSKQKVSIVGISLGICALSESIIYSPENTIVTNTFVISLDEEEQTIQSNAVNSVKSYELNGLVINSSFILAFSGILKLLINNNSTTGNIISLNHHLQDFFYQKTFFTKSIKFFLSFVLGLLLINFFVFNHYYKKAEEVTQNLLLNKSSIESIQKLKKRVSIKEQKFKKTMEFKSSKSSLIINEIAEKVPPSIILSELVYDPLEKKIKESETILTNKATILLSGKTIDNNAFTNWIKSIEKLKSINKVVIVHFGKNDTNETVFSIKVNLNNNEIK